MKESPLFAGLAAFVLLTIVIHLFARRRSVQSIVSHGNASRWRFRATLLVVGLVAMALGAGMAAIGIRQESVQIIEAAKPRTIPENYRREASEILKGRNTFKQIGLATFNYDTEHGVLPLGTTYDQNGRALHGWHMALLPFLSQENLYSQFNLKKAWNHPDNDQFSRAPCSMFSLFVVTSSVDDYGYPITTYAANVHVLGGEQPRRIADFENGTSNVLLFGEMAGNFRGWAYPHHLRDPKLGLKRTPDGFGGPWKAGTHFLLADGSMRCFRDDTDPEFLEMLAKPRNE